MKVDIKVDFSKKIGEIKPLHGVGQPPQIGHDYRMFSYLKEAGIPYSRLHDVGGAFGGGIYVDITNIFRNFDADPYDENSYDFIFTDRLIKELMENDCEPIYRLGETIETQSSIKYYRVVPPKDYNKWAIICEHIIKHYNYGWANGFNYNIKYWEIWNEPDNNGDIKYNNMWKAPKEEYFKLYNIASKHLKKCFPELKIGGYGSSGFYTLSSSTSQNTGSNARYEYLKFFFDEFVKFVKENNCPLDFFSWHHYDQIEPLSIYANYVRKTLDDAGYKDTESSLNEWAANCHEKGTLKHAAFITGMILKMQNLPIDSANVYDARCGVGMYSLLFSPETCLPYKSFYGLKAFNELYKRKNQVQLKMDFPAIYAVAAADENSGCIVIANNHDTYWPLNIELDREIEKCYIISESKNLELCEMPSIIRDHEILCIITK